MLSNLENLTLSQLELEACRPLRQGDGQRLRAFCPFHGSDHQRSLAVKLDTGRFECYACGAWGYLEEKRRVPQPRPGHRPLSLIRRPVPAPPSPVRPPVLPRPDLTATWSGFQQALAESWGARYLASRGLSVTLATRYGVGYAPAGQWPNPKRDWRGGRLVFPHHTPAGDLVNLYGRAVGSEAKGLQKKDRHDHLPGPKAWFNAAALTSGDGPLYVCEGAFDALSLIAAGCARAIAIYGLDGWRWDWIPPLVSDIALCFDHDPPGSDGRPSRAATVVRQLAQQAVLRGKRAWLLPPEALGGEKDLSAAWAKGVLKTGMLCIG